MKSFRCVLLVAMLAALPLLGGCTTVKNWGNNGFKGGPVATLNRTGQQVNYDLKRTGRAVTNPFKGLIKDAWSLID